MKWRISLVFIFFAYVTNKHIIILQCDVKVRSASAETKSKRLLDQKINGLEEKLKKSIKNVEDLQAELKTTKNLLNEKGKEAEALQVSLDKALCEKQEIGHQYEAKDELLQSYQSSTSTTIQALQKELDNTQEELEKTKINHEQQVLQLQKELGEVRNTLNSSNIAHEKQLQETTKAFEEEHNTSLADCEVSIF